MWLSRSAIVLTSLLWSSAWADQLVMKNGDRVTGSIVKQDGKTITIKSGVFGVITAPWDQVESVKSDTPLNVVLKDGRTVQGALSTSDGKVEVAGQATKVDVAPDQVATIRNADEQTAYERRLKPGLTQLWTGVGSVGLAGANGNAKTLTFTSAFDAARVTNTDKTSLHFDAIEASALVDGKSADTAQAVRGGVGYDHNVTSRFFANAFNDYEYDKFQNLNLRFTIGGGFGFHAVKGKRATLDLVGGVDYSHSSFSTPLIRNEAEAYWGDDYNLKLFKTSALVQSFRMFDGVSGAGGNRVNFDAGLSTKLAKWFNWNLSLSDRYLSNPAPGRKTNDWLYSTGLGFTLGK
jgi:putative salt-induced outer membrane protein YdiY